MLQISLEYVIQVILSSSSTLRSTWNFGNNLTVVYQFLLGNSQKLQRTKNERGKNEERRTKEPVFLQQERKYYGRRTYGTELRTKTELYDDCHQSQGVMSYEGCER